MGDEIMPEEYQKVIDQRDEAIIECGTRAGRIRYLETRLGELQEHNDTAPHEGCGCRVCGGIRRVVALEKIILSAPGFDEKDFEGIYRKWWNTHYRHLREQKTLTARNRERRIDV